MGSHRHPVQQVEKFEIAKHLKAKKEERKAVTLWLPQSYKVKYDQIQEHTGNDFSKYAVTVLKTLIDSVDLNNVHLNFPNLDK